MPSADFCPVVRRPHGRPNPCVSLSLHLHQVGWKTFTSELLNMPGTQRTRCAGRGWDSRLGLWAEGCCLRGCDRLIDPYQDRRFQMAKVSPPRLRMTEDMTLRNLSPATRNSPISTRSRGSAGILADRPVSWGWRTCAPTSCTSSPRSSPGRTSIRSPAPCAADDPKCRSG